MADHLRGPFSVLLCPLPEVPFPALFADGFGLGLPGAEGAFADAGFAGKGGTAEARPLAEGQNLPGLSLVQKAVVPVQQVGHRDAVQFRQPVYDGRGGVFAGAGLHVDVERCGDTHPLGHLPLQQTHLEAAPPQPVGDAIDLLVTAVLPGEPLGLGQVGRWDEPEPVHGQRRKAGLAVVGAAEYVKIRRDPGEHLPFWQRLENPFRCSSRNSQTGLFVRIALTNYMGNTPTKQMRKLPFVNIVFPAPASTTKAPWITPERSCSRQYKSYGREATTRFICARSHGISAASILKQWRSANSILLFPLSGQSCGILIARSRSVQKHSAAKSFTTPMKGATTLIYLSYTRQNCRPPSRLYSTTGPSVWITHKTVCTVTPMVTVPNIPDSRQSPNPNGKLYNKPCPVHTLAAGAGVLCAPNWPSWTDILKINVVIGNTNNLSVSCRITTSLLPKIWILWV